MRRAPVTVLALVLVAAATPALAASPEFDDQRLFTTAEQRAHLDDVRDGTAVRRDEPEERRDEPALPEIERPPPPPSVRLQGFVRRSGGPPAVWVNEDSTLAGDRVAGDLRVHSGHIRGDTVVIELPDGRIVRLKPGQTWDPESGQVVDRYRR